MESQGFDYNIQSFERIQNEDTEIYFSYTVYNLASIWMSVFLIVTTPYPQPPAFNQSYWVVLFCWGKRLLLTFNKPKVRQNISLHFPNWEEFNSITEKVQNLQSNFSRLQRLQCELNAEFQLMLQVKLLKKIGQGTFNCSGAGNSGKNIHFHFCSN